MHFSPCHCIAAGLAILVTQALAKDDYTTLAVPQYQPARCLGIREDNGDTAVVCDAVIDDLTLTITHTIVKPVATPTSVASITHQLKPRRDSACPVLTLTVLSIPNWCITPVTTLSSSKSLALPPAVTASSQKSAPPPPHAPSSVSLPVVGIVASSSYMRQTSVPTPSFASPTIPIPSATSSTTFSRSTQAVSIATPAPPSANNSQKQWTSIILGFALACALSTIVLVSSV